MLYEQLGGHNEIINPDNYLLPNGAFAKRESVG